MEKVTIDVTEEYAKAEAALAKANIDFALQYGIPDIERKLRAAWIHGYVEALIRNPSSEKRYANLKLPEGAVI